VNPQELCAPVAVEICEPDLFACCAEFRCDEALRQPADVRCLGPVFVGNAEVEIGGDTAIWMDPEIFGAAVPVEIGKVDGIGGVIGNGFARRSGQRLSKGGAIYVRAGALVSTCGAGSWNLY